MTRSVQSVALTIASAVCGVLVASVPLSAASAHGDNESDESKVLVQQAIALIVNTPDDEMSIEERITDALEAPHTEGTDIAMVRQAMAAFDSGDMDRARTLLQTSIGAGPYLGEGLPPEVGETTGEPGQPLYAVGEATGTTIVLDELDPGRDFDAGDVVLLLLSGLSIVVGLGLAWRYRPKDTVRQLRRTLRAGGSE